jgi:hypothetical protein
MNVVIKPAIDQCYLRQLEQVARRNNDELLALLNDAQWLDSERSQRWMRAFIRFCAEESDDNSQAIAAHIQKWVPPVDAAIDAYCKALCSDQNVAAQAKQSAATFRREFGAEI